MNEQARTLTSHRIDGGFSVGFRAMASPCEVLLQTDDEQHALWLGRIAATEAWRIEDKYSRYLATSACSELNARAGELCYIDDETYQLLLFAEQCYRLSDGLFDISSGVLRKVWYFDGSDNVPDAAQVAKVLPLVGWHKVKLTADSVQMQPNMELDFGGLGKEYAVDRALMLMMQQSDCPMLVNFGGDLAANQARLDGLAWQIGIEHPGFSEQRQVIVALKQGAIATSGDARRFLLKDGHRYSHILNVKTGWPVEQAPHSLTVTAPQCIQAGFIATLALLQGANAEQFLQQQQIKYWSIR